MVEIQTAIAEITESIRDGSQWSVAVIDNAERTVASRYAPEPVKAASLNKLAISYAFNVIDRDGDTNLMAQEVRIEPEDIRKGAGRLRYFPIGYSLDLGDALRLSLSESDDTATRIVTRIVGGPARVNEILDDPLSGLSRTRLKLVDDTSAPDARYEYGVTTAAEIAKLLACALRVPAQADALHHGNYSRGLRYKIETHQSAEMTPLTDVARYISTMHLARPLQSIHKGSMDAFYAKVLARPSGTYTAFPNKEGRLPCVRHDVAQIGDFIIAALSTSHAQATESSMYHPARETLSELGEVVLNSQV